MSSEIWKQIPGYKYYQVSNLGRVKSFYYLKEGKILKPQIKESGYQHIRLSNNGNPREFHIARLVLQTFVGECPKGRRASHLNDIKTDNRLCNLKWETEVVNRLLRVALSRIGEFNYTNEEKINIKNLLKQIKEKLK